MKKTLFFIAYSVTPIPPIAAYLASVGEHSNAYALSVCCGVVAFILLCNQFILASRPRFAIEALGLKGLLSFHRAMPAIALALALIHRTLKIGLNPNSKGTALVSGLGFSDDTLQASLGSVVWWLFGILAVFSVLFMANMFFQKINFLKRFRAWIYAKTGLDYKAARAAHNVAIIAGIGILVHALLAGSSDIGKNPVGAIWLAAWMMLSLGLYVRYRIVNASKKGAKRA